MVGPVRAEKQRIRRSKSARRKKNLTVLQESPEKVLHKKNVISLKTVEEVMPKVFRDTSHVNGQFWYYWCDFPLKYCDDTVALQFHVQSEEQLKSEEETKKEIERIHSSLVLQIQDIKSTMNNGRRPPQQRDNFQEGSNYHLRSSRDNYSGHRYKWRWRSDDSDIWGPNYDDEECNSFEYTPSAPVEEQRSYYSPHSFSNSQPPYRGYYNNYGSSFNSERYNQRPYRQKYSNNRGRNFSTPYIPRNNRIEPSNITTPVRSSLPVPVHENATKDINIEKTEDSCDLSLKVNSIPDPDDMEVEATLSKITDPSSTGTERNRADSVAETVCNEVDEIETPTCSVTTSKPIPAPRRRCKSVGAPPDRARKSMRIRAQSECRKPIQELCVAPRITRSKSCEFGLLCESLPINFKERGRSTKHRGRARGKMISEISRAKTSKSSVQIRLDTDSESDVSSVSYNSSSSDKPRKVHVPKIIPVNPVDVVPSDPRVNRETGPRGMISLDEFHYLISNDKQTNKYDTLKEKKLQRLFGEISSEKTSTPEIAPEDSKPSNPTASPAVVLAKMPWDTLLRTTDRQLKRRYSELAEVNDVVKMKSTADVTHRRRQSSGNENKPKEFGSSTMKNTSTITKLEIEARSRSKKHPTKEAPLKNPIKMTKASKITKKVPPKLAFYSETENSRKHPTTNTKQMGNDSGIQNTDKTVLIQQKVTTTSCEALSHTATTKSHLENVCDNLKPRQKQHRDQPPLSLNSQFASKLFECDAKKQQKATISTSPTKEKKAKHPKTDSMKSGNRSEEQHQPKKQTVPVAAVGKKRDRKSSNCEELATTKCLKMDRKSSEIASNIKESSVKKAGKHFFGKRSTVIDDKPNGKKLKIISDNKLKTQSKEADTNQSISKTKTVNDKLKSVIDTLKSKRKFEAKVANNLKKSTVNQSAEAQHGSTLPGVALQKMNEPIKFVGDREKCPIKKDSSHKCLLSTQAEKLSSVDIIKPRFLEQRRRSSSTASADPLEEVLSNCLPTSTHLNSPKIPKPQSKAIAINTIFRHNMPKNVDSRRITIPATEKPTQSKIKNMERSKSIEGTSQIITTKKAKERKFGKCAANVKKPKQSKANNKKQFDSHDLAQPAKRIKLNGKSQEGSTICASYQEVFEQSAIPMRMSTNALDNSITLNVTNDLNETVEVHINNTPNVEVVESLASVHEDPGFIPEVAEELDIEIVETKTAHSFIHKTCPKYKACVMEQAVVFEKPKTEYVTAKCDKGEEDQNTLEIISLSSDSDDEIENVKIINEITNGVFYDAIEPKNVLVGQKKLSTDASETIEQIPNEANCSVLGDPQRASPAQLSMSLDDSNRFEMISPYVEDNSVCPTATTSDGAVQTDFIDRPSAIDNFTQTGDKSAPVLSASIDNGSQTTITCNERMETLRTIPVSNPPPALNRQPTHVVNYQHSAEFFSLHISTHLHLHAMITSLLKGYREAGVSKNFVTDAYEHVLLAYTYSSTRMCNRFLEYFSVNHIPTFNFKVFLQTICEYLMTRFRLIHPIRNMVRTLYIIAKEIQKIWPTPFTQVFLEGATIQVLEISRLTAMADVQNQVSANQQTPSVNTLPAHAFVHSTPRTNQPIATTSGSNFVPTTQSNLQNPLPSSSLEVCGTSRTGVPTYSANNIVNVNPPRTLPFFPTTSITAQSKVLPPHPSLVIHNAPQQNHMSGGLVTAAPQSLQNVPYHNTGRPQDSMTRGNSLLNVTPQIDALRGNQQMTSHQKAVYFDQCKSYVALSNILNLHLRRLSLSAQNFKRHLATAGQLPPVPQFTQRTASNAVPNTRHEATTASLPNAVQHHYAQNYPITTRLLTDQYVSDNINAVNTSNRARNNMQQSAAALVPNTTNAQNVVNRFRAPNVNVANFPAMQQMNTQHLRGHPTIATLSPSTFEPFKHNQNQPTPIESLERLFAPANENFRIRLPMSKPLDLTTSISPNASISTPSTSVNTEQPAPPPPYDSAHIQTPAERATRTVDECITNVIVHATSNEDDKVQNKENEANGGNQIETHGCKSETDPDVVDVDEWFAERLRSDVVIDLDDYVDYFKTEEEVPFIKQDCNDEESTDEGTLVISEPAECSNENDVVAAVYPEMILDRICICSKRAWLVCQCRYAIYCSQECQMINWNDHRDICWRTRHEDMPII